MCTTRLVRELLTIQNWRSVCENVYFVPIRLCKAFSPFFGLFVAAGVSSALSAEEACHD